VKAIKTVDHTQNEKRTQAGQASQRASEESGTRSMSADGGMVVQSAICTSEMKDGSKGER
jgi:hypothetical protein